VTIIPLPTRRDWTPDDFEPDPRGRGRRLRPRKPRVPWTKPRRPRGAREYAECGGPKIYRDRYDSAQGFAAAVRKACGPKKAAREFDVGGPESGTLVGARRAPGLFDDNWGTAFPLTRAEQRAMQEGELVTDPFFAPPTTANPGNWIADRLNQLRQRMSPTVYNTATGLRPLCGDPGYGITCAGPDGEVGWTGGTRPLTKEEAQEFLAAYCSPGRCLTAGLATPPAGYKEFIIRTKPANPGTASRFTCGPAAIAPVAGTTLPLPSLPQPPAPPPPPQPITNACPPTWYWAVGLTGCRCVPPNIGAPYASSEDLARCGIFF